MKKTDRQPLLRSFRRTATITLLVIATSLASGNVLAQVEPDIDAVHWAWGIPDDRWHGELKDIVLALENAELETATERLARWVADNADDALLALPLLEQFFFDNPNHELAFVYVGAFGDLALAERMYALAVLNLNNLAVAEVGHATLVHAWQNEPQTVVDWYSNTPSFTNYSALDTFASWLKSNGPADALARLVLPLTFDNLKRARYFQDGITHWVRSDLDAAVAHFDSVAATLTTEEAQWNGSFALVATTIAERLAQQGDIKQALDWVLRIINPYDADNAKLYVAQGITTAENAHLMDQWLKQHPVAEEDILNNIKAHLSAIAQ